VAVVATDLAENGRSLERIEAIMVDGVLTVISSRFRMSMVSVGPGVNCEEVEIGRLLEGSKSSPPSEFGMSIAGCCELGAVVSSLVGSLSVWLSSASIMVGGVDFGNVGFEIEKAAKSSVRLSKSTVFVEASCSVVTVPCVLAEVFSALVRFSCF